MEIINPKKPFLIIQHEDSTPAGSTIEWLDSQSIPFQVCRIHQNEKLPPITDVAGLILCGGTPNVDQEAEYPWLVREKLYLAEAIKRELPIIGLCLGAQLLAECLGAQVAQHPHWEVGWHDVELEDHHFLPKRNEPVKMFQWHGYSFDMPPDSVVIGQSAGCSNQGFIYKDHIVGFQFHPESTREWIQDCVETLEEGYSVNCPIGTFVQHPEEIQSHHLNVRETMSQWYWEFLERFLLTRATSTGNLDPA